MRFGEQVQTNFTNDVDATHKQVTTSVILVLQEKLYQSGGDCRKYAKNGEYMDVILEIYHLIRRLVSRKDPATKVLLTTDNLSTKLLQGFFSGTYTSDEQAAKDLYPDTRRGRATYRQLKYTLVNNLTNVLFFLNLRSPKYSQ